MAYHDTTLESELLEHFSCLSVSRDESIIKNELQDSDTTPGLLHLSDEVLIVILNRLEPVCLLRLGSTCSRLFRVSSCDSLWTRHFRDSFGVGLPNITTAGYAAKTAFRLVFMWRSLFRNIHCNRSLQEKLFAEVPFPPHAYWTQWLVMEERVPLPAAQLTCADVERLWGMPRELFTEKLHEKPEGDETLRMEWRELYNLAVTHHGSTTMLFHYVLKQHQSSDHSELESMYRQYTQCRFQWLFTYWLFRQPAPLNRQLRAIYLQWRKHSKKKVSTWGETVCDVRYLASLHPITSDYWRGKLARGDENVGIHTVGNYFSMCKSLVAWILGRDWGRLKRRKVYEDTLDGVYLLLKREMQERLVEHERFWQVAKVQMSRVCTLEETAVNYVNWKMIETLPYYKLYLVSGNSVYLQHVQGFLRRKRMLHDWIYLEDNTWLRELLPEELFTLLEFDTKISQALLISDVTFEECPSLLSNPRPSGDNLHVCLKVQISSESEGCVHTAGSLHGASASAQLSRLIWLYLHSGEQLYMEGVKQTVLQYVHARLAISTNALSADLWQPVLRPVSP